MGHNRFSELPRGIIVALALVGDGFFYGMARLLICRGLIIRMKYTFEFDTTPHADPIVHADWEWAFGPFCYHIIDVIRTSVSYFC